MIEADEKVIIIVFLEKETSHMTIPNYEIQTAGKKILTSLTLFEIAKKYKVECK
jgi:hypothetical protein